MTPAQNIDPALVARMVALCEAATQADRGLDASIAAALGWRKVPNPTAAGGLIDAWLNPAGQQVRWSIPFYTASVDAAWTLAPEGWNVGQWSITGKPDSCRMWNDAHDIVASGSTPALALTTASLHALAALRRNQAPSQ